MKYGGTLYISSTFLAALLYLSSCGPVNMLTRTKKVPLRYSVNYNHDNVKSQRSELNGKAWIVYSDREDNVTTMKPGGSLECKKLKYLEPLYVIGKRGDYYKLIKYDPAVLNNEYLSKYKEAKFYGWIHKDMLLLFNNSSTEVRNGIRLKNLTSITDCSLVLEAERHFSNDSIILYSNPNLTQPKGSIGLGNIVYVMKQTDNNSRVLISQKMTISPDDVEEMTIGWIDASLIAPFGQRLVLSRPPKVIDPDRGGNIHNVTPVVSLNPVLYAHRTGTSFVFRTLDASEIFDHSDNVILNIDGQPINYQQGKRISADMNNINVIFAFVSSGNVVKRMPLILNAVQNLKPVFETAPSNFKYNYAATIADKTIAFENDYLSFSHKLIEAGKKMGRGSFVGSVRSALALAALAPRATNIIILIGEKASGWRSVPKDIRKGLVENNCRLLSYQVFDENDDAYNNFVLHSLDMIEWYAKDYQTRKRSIMVYTDRLRTRNMFAEGAKNVYSLDFPNRSMTQGMVVFPEKGQFASLDILISCVDSLVRQVESDNMTLVGSIERAFIEGGWQRSRFHADVITKLNVESQTKIIPYVGKAFNEVSPKLTEVTERVSISIDSVNVSSMGLLLTESELKDIKAWVKTLSSMKPDVMGQISSSDKAKARRVKRVRRELSGIPADEYNESKTEQDIVMDSLDYIEYAPTGRIRRHIKRCYRRVLAGCVVNGSARNLTLAQAQEYITTMPTISPTLNNICIKDLTNKSKFSDMELDLLIKYFEQQKQLIENTAQSLDDLSIPGGEKLFFLPSKAMP